MDGTKKKAFARPINSCLSDTRRCTSLPCMSGFCTYLQTKNHIWFSSSFHGEFWPAQNLGNQWLGAYRWCWCWDESASTSPELSESQGRGFQNEPGCGCFLRMGTQKNSKNLIPGMLSALLHADSSHKNQTVHLDPRMWRMFLSLIGMKQSAERQGGAAPLAKAWQLMSAVEAGGCPSHFPTAHLLPGYKKLCFAESQVLGLWYAW